MSKAKSFQLFILAMIVLSFMFPFIGNTSVKPSVNLGDNEKRSDIITLELSAELSKNEMPAVDFLHDKHTESLEGKCTSCHTQNDKAFVFKFKRTETDGSMDLYHNECVACHVEKKSQNKTFGPLAAECRTCHTEEKNIGSSWTKMEFDKSLHFVHERAKPIKAINSTDKNNCSACHHKANEKTNETFYTQGEEESCAYCHKSGLEGQPGQISQIDQPSQQNPSQRNEVRPIREAAHDSCVKCHQTLTGQNVAAGPTTCNGCHDLEKQKEIEKVADIPRLKRNQPDEVALTGWKLGSKLENTFMPGVAFNHKSHESNTQSCKTCHHETLKKCSECHDAEGGELSGDFISLEKAMHSTNSDRSCIGCHKEETKSKDCAGCHSLASAYKTDSESCNSCHTMNPVKLNNSDSTQMVRMALKNQYEPVAQNSIPEMVVIKSLSSDYMESNFPHRKVVNAIAGRVEKSEMAKLFHEDQAGLCMGCHHNSPKTLEPPKCASCHSKKGPSVDGRPGLKGAYHGQCISCHQKMEVEIVLATDCVKCHEEKK
jgi:class III cytochrome C family protein/cytochrome c7-like protein